MEVFFQLGSSSTTGVVSTKKMKGSIAKLKEAVKKEEESYFLDEMKKPEKLSSLPTYNSDLVYERHEEIEAGTEFPAPSQFNKNTHLVILRAYSVPKKQEFTEKLSQRQRQILLRVQS